MTFKIISCGWNCADYMLQTLESIEMQTCRDFEVCMGYAAGSGNDPGIKILDKWLESHGTANYNVFIRGESVLDTQNRYEATKLLDPQLDDIIVTLDLDGDRFAHSDVLAHLLDYYADGTLTTYGSYLPDPPDAGCAPAIAYPPEVVAQRSYRAFGNIYFNHLRTMKGRVFNAIPVDQFKWSRGPQAGQWYEKACDVTFTLSALELAGHRFKVIDEVLMYYNSINPLSNWRITGELSTRCTLDFMSRPPLPELP